MARLAAFIVAGGDGTQRRMRIVAGQAGKCPCTVAKARGAAQVRRLVTYVPGVRPVVLLAHLGRFAVTTPAEFVQLRGIEPFWIANGTAGARRLHVRRAGTVTRFAADAGFAGFDVRRLAETQSPGGVAGKATQGRRCRVEGAEADVFSAFVPRCG